MDSSRVLLALQEQEKWKERRKRVEERLRQIRSRRRYFLNELSTVRQKVAQFGALFASLKGRAARAIAMRGGTASRPHELR